MALHVTPWSSPSIVEIFGFSLVFQVWLGDFFLLAVG